MPFVSFGMDKKHDWVIYKMVNPTGSIYIGKTSNFTKRMSHYRNLSLKQPKLLASLKKYGYGAHNVSVVETFNGNCNYADGKEMFWIRSYMSNFIKWPECNGLNLTNGGQGTIGYKATDELRKRLSDSHKGLPSGRKGVKMSEEDRIKMKERYKNNPSLVRRGYKHSKETIEKIAATKRLRYPAKIKIRPTKEETSLKISLAKKGQPAWNKGIPMTQKQKDILSAANKGKPSHKKGVKFQGTEEERKIKFGAHNIGNSYNKGRKHSSEIVERMRLSRTGAPNTALYKPVIQYDKNGVFIKEHDSIKTASFETGVSKWTIADIAKGTRKTKPDKYIFKYKT